jgi:hypothetical protein
VQLNRRQNGLESKAFNGRLDRNVAYCGNGELGEAAAAFVSMVKNVEQVLAR